MTTVEVAAPAKVNLTLHVTGQRNDGYHLIDSLVAFAPVHDRLVIKSGPSLELAVTGTESAMVPSGMQNLALKAASLVKGGAGSSVLLEKLLPVAAGVGGGSADAAAVLRGLAPRHEDLPARARSALALGADVPMCLSCRPCRVGGIGERIEFVDLPSLPAVLVNPRTPVSTAKVFASLARKDNRKMPDDLPPARDVPGAIEWLSEQRNDLEPAALEEAPVIADVLALLRTSLGCGLARVSGSGATCFGLFGDERLAREAKVGIAELHPDWWLASGQLGDQSELASPRVRPG
ncbi:MAG: 4-(cytidine 5'-diphospho)-2-C-methyl-D-erythritol kinase [Boseongicola sp. SB0676_bin_33]|uniref:4-diphosphocytidyl-2-C-methyl-D-erythritol kinase n=1 Tax=Boseongicola sp. SB0664_bin_43 TaxID=2604844 RepID=A0A6B0Y1N5_9RHOB|nr:4-(cytidine 5'-diphospho)-2-C-methyl-D-erythritol kinase [Boseongicola sp. SB0664_bin_43]MYF89795.1 4-(cytidine 5'-diphospho)-2-C-methyl-D-erythritol kinase [Boseongicola sp. SB0676_bin_33]